MPASTTAPEEASREDRSPVWLLRAGPRGRYATDFVSGGTAAIGWEEVGDARGKARKDLIASVSKRYGAKGAPSAGGMLWRFANELSIGDYVLTPDSETRELHVGRLTGEYEYRSDPPIEGYPHIRTVEWSGSFSRDELPKRILYQLGSLLTLSQPSAQEELYAFLSRPSPSEDSTDDSASDAAAGDIEDSELYEQLRSQTGELIRAQVAELDGYETQDLVAGILGVMGYFTQVSPEGRDGGVDIRASRDALGIQPPILKVQVKARPNDRSGPSEIRELAGLLQSPEEHGLFVSTGGYTRDAEHDARTARISLIGMGRLIELLLENYERLDQDTQSLVPLRRLLVP